MPSRVSHIAIAALLAATAGAQEEAASGPALRRGGYLPFPDALLDQAVLDQRCQVMVRLDDKGRAVDMTTVDCDEDVADWMFRRLRRWRWEAPAEADQEVWVDVVFEPPWSMVEPPLPDYWRRDGGQQCTAKWHFAPDGSLRDQEVQTGCPVVTLKLDPTPEAILKQGHPESCPVTFLWDGTEVDHVDTFRCTQRLRRHVRKALRKAAFEVDAEELPMPLSVVMIFHHQ